MAYQARNQGGHHEYEVDAEADLATITNPKRGEFALAIAEGSLHFHDGTQWVAISGGTGGSGVDVEDDGTPVDTADTIDFGLGLNVTDDGGGHVTVDWAHTVDHTVNEISVAEGTGNFNDTALTTAGQVFVYEGANGDMVPGDHGNLAGLADDDHTQYVLEAATPGGELGGTYASPTVDATHSGSTHAATQAAAEATAAAANTADIATHAGAADPHTVYLKETDFDDVDFLVGTATGHTGAEIVVGTTPGGELGNTWASPTVDATHSGSSHAGVISTHEGLSDPHTGYRLESADHTHATTGAQAGQIAHSALTGLTSGDDHTQYLKEADFNAKGDIISASANDTPSVLSVGANGTMLTAQSGQTTGLQWATHHTLAGPWSKEGNLSTGTGTARWYNDTGRTLTLVSARGSVGTAPASQSILIDVNINGTSAWASTQANRITIAAAGNTDQGGAFDTTTIADGYYLTVDIDQVGSGTVGADLTVQVYLSG